MRLDSIVITHNVEEDCMYVEAPYHKQYLEHLKASIPYPDRKWNPDKKAWEIHIDWLQTLDDLLEVFFPDQKVEWVEV